MEEGSGKEGMVCFARFLTIPELRHFLPSGVGFQIRKNVMDGPRPHSQPPDNLIPGHKYYVVLARTSLVV